jgi:lipoprotein NlpI
MRQWREVFFIVALWLAVSLANADDAADGLINRAKKAYSSGQRAEAVALASQAIRAEPTNSQAYFVRARLYEDTGESTKALTDYDQVLKLDRRNAAAWQNRGILHFKLAHIDQSISDFDQFIKLMPEQAPHHWQRGICYYYAQRFEDGRKQFELHQTVNPNDVENAVWHFLCVARSAGIEKAKASLMPIPEDARVPMMQIHALFAGKVKTDDVLKAASAGEPGSPEGQRAKFYAHLYLGLYSEAVGDETKALQHITKAVEYGGADYMSDVARVHLKLKADKKKH